MDDFDDLHLTPELMAALVRNELPPTVLASLLLNHLLAICPTCRTALRTSFSTVKAEHGFEAALDRTQKAIEQRQRLLSKELHSARRDLTELLRTPIETRESRVKRASARFRSPLLVGLLIEESRSVMRDEPDAALQLATLARAVAERVAPEAVAAESRVRASAHQGNAFRVSGDLSAAEVPFMEARALLKRDMVTDPLIHAEVARLEGSLRIDQRRFEDAEYLLSQAVLLYRVAREKRNVAISLMNLANLHRLRDEIPAAIEAGFEAISIIDREKDPELADWAHHNLASYLCSHQDFIAARRVLAQIPFQGQGKSTKARRLWLEGRIAKGLEEFERAEELLTAAITGFRRLKLPLFVGLCVLDLAELHLIQGRTDELMGLAKDLDPIFAMPDLHAEASQALLLFQNAALQRLLSMQMLHEVRARLERLRVGLKRSAEIC